jgi:hypothetical protein
MFRHLQPIEIAEGALIADVAVIFHLLAIYIPIPVGHMALRLPIFIVFAVRVLRRGLYTGIIALCVSLFTVAVIVGFIGVPFLLLEVSGGLFLGVAMRWRMPHILLLLSGITFGALIAYVMLFPLLLLTGQSFAAFIQGLHLLFNLGIQIADTVMGWIGVSAWWHEARTTVISFSAFAFTYWWLSLYIVSWLYLCPAVCVIYVFTNSIVRLLGFDVRPFPGGWFYRFLRGLNRRLLRVRLWRTTLKRMSGRA